MSSSSFPDPSGTVQPVIRVLDGERRIWINDLMICRTVLVLDWLTVRFRAFAKDERDASGMALLHARRICTGFRRTGAVGAIGS